MTTKVRIAARYEVGNLTAATIIAGNPELYPEGSLAALWSDLVLTRAAERDDAAAGPLFAQRAA